MINIRPISDLRNKYPEIEKFITETNEPVYLTKNGYGSMVVLSLKKYSELADARELLNRPLPHDSENPPEFIAAQFKYPSYEAYVEAMLEETDRRIAEGGAEYLSGEEVFSAARARINENRKKLGL